MLAKVLLNVSYTKKDSLTCSTKTNDCKWSNQTETSGLLLAEQKMDCKW